MSRHMVRLAFPNVEGYPRMTQALVKGRKVNTVQFKPCVLTETGYDGHLYRCISKTASWVLYPYCMPTDASAQLHHGYYI